MTTELELKDKIELVLAYINRCDDDDLAKKIAWNIGQQAIQQDLHADATILFQVCLDKTPEDSREERLLASFFKCQAVYHDPKHAYTDTDLKDLEKSRQLSEETFPKSRSKKTAPRVRTSKSSRNYCACLQRKPPSTCPNGTSWCQTFEKAPSEKLMSLILGSSVNIPIEIHLMCLHKLLDSIADIDVDRFATLFRGTATAALLFDTTSAIAYFHQVHSIVKSMEYPREEALWLCVTCFNTATLLQSWKNKGKAQEWCELAISFTHCLHPDDKEIYELRIRNGYSSILQGTK